MPATFVEPALADQVARATPPIQERLLKVPAVPTWPGPANWQHGGDVTLLMATPGCPLDGRLRL
jgi:hypothetical protein